jgi:succinate dehydrogenase/fumarate reductase flavoprotein subunit
MYPAMKFDEFPCAFLRIAPKTSYSWIDVAKDGCRFWNETRDWNATHYHELRHGNWVDASFLSAGPVHMIFDDRTRRTSPLSYGDRRAMTWNNVVERYVWSADNSTEIAKGWIKTASSVSELARLIGKDPARLEETVKQYNRACADGADQQCGREGNTLQPILTPPFHAVGLVPGAICTTGGAKRNELAQVLSTRGTPIPRLYEAGELGSIMGNLYQNGSFLTECIVFGRIAGRNVAKETAWA